MNNTTRMEEINVEEKGKWREWEIGQEERKRNGGIGNRESKREGLRERRKDKYKKRYMTGGVDIENLSNGA